MKKINLTFIISVILYLPSYANPDIEEKILKTAKEMGISVYEDFPQPITTMII